MVLFAFSCCLEFSRLQGFRVFRVFIQGFKIFGAFLGLGFRLQGVQGF